MPQVMAYADAIVADPYLRSLFATIHRLEQEEAPGPNLAYQNPHPNRARSTPTPSRILTPVDPYAYSDEDHPSPPPSPTPGPSRRTHRSSSSQPLASIIRTSQLRAPLTQPNRIIVIEDDSSEDTGSQDHLREQEERKKKERKIAEREVIKKGKRRVPFANEADYASATGEAIPLTPPRSSSCLKVPVLSPSSYEVSPLSHSDATEGWHLAGALSQGVSGARVRHAPDVPSPRILHSPQLPSTRKTYVVYQGRSVGVFTTWPCAGLSIANLKAAVYESFPTLLQAERAWLLANRMGAVRVINSSENLTPCQAFPREAVEALIQFPEDHFGRPFYVVLKGRSPGIYPFWGLAASQVKQVKNAITEHYNTFAEAGAIWNEAYNTGVVQAL